MRPLLNYSAGHSSTKTPLAYMPARLSRLDPHTLEAPQKVDECFGIVGGEDPAMTLLAPSTAL